MSAAHEVGTEQREGDGVTRLGGQLQTLLEHLLKCTTVKAIRREKDREREGKRRRGSERERERGEEREGKRKREGERGREREKRGGIERA